VLLIAAGLFVALTSTAVAARQYVITSTKQISPSVLKQLKGRTGAQGKPGPTGATGAVGAAGPRGIQGPQGIAGPAGPAGATGATGATGAAGTSGAPVSARAYGSVDANGTLRATLSSGVTQATRVSAGVYCVTIDPTRWTRGSSWPVVTSDYADNSELFDTPGGAGDHLVTVRYSSAPTCTGNAFRVVATRLDLDADATASNGHQPRATLSDEPFSFVLP